jgi:hypothetical protein
LANPTTNLFQTVVAAASAASENLRYKNALVDCIYWDYQPVVATPYTTLNVIIPTVNEGAVVDIQSGPLQPMDYTYNPTSITLSKNFSVSFVVKSWDQIRTPVDLQRLFIQPNLEALLRKINRTIVALFSATNFPNYTLFTGTSGTAADFTRGDIGTAWQNLVNAGVPIDTDQQNAFLIVNPLSYSTMLADQNFIYQYIVGDTAAIEAQQRARLRAIFGAEVLYDQMLVPFNSGHQPAILMHRYAVAAVTANPPPGGPNVEETYLMLKNAVPVQLQMAYSMQDQGWVIHMHAMWGLAVVRPEMASLFQSES